MYQHMRLSGPPWRAYWRTYGLPDIAVLHADGPPEFAVVSTRRLIPITYIGSGKADCADAERLRLHLDMTDRAGWPSLLHLMSDKP